MNYSFALLCLTITITVISATTIKPPSMICIKKTNYRKLIKRYKRCVARKRVLKHIFDGSGELPIRSVPPKNKEVSKVEFQETKHLVLDKIRASRFKRQDKKIFETNINNPAITSKVTDVSSDDGVNRYNSKNTKRSTRHSECPVDSEIKSSLTDLPWSAEVYYSGVIESHRGTGGVINMCTECHYDIQLPHSYRPNFIKHVHCTHESCMVGLASCVQRQVEVKVFEDHGNDDFSEHSIFVNKACCCQLKSIFAAFFGYY